MMSINFYFLTESSILHQLIEVLEKCEVFASEKIKQFHSSNIKQVEQMMDLESSIKTKETVIDVLTNGKNILYLVCPICISLY